MANKLTKENLVEEMLIKLQVFNNEGVALSGESVHDEVLSPDDGFESSPSSKKLYYGAMQWTIWANKGTKVKWPNNWITYTVNDLADFIMSKQ